MARITVLSSRELNAGFKINAIKSLRTATGLGLKEAKDCIDDIPSTIEVPSYLSPTIVLDNLHERGFEAQIEVTEPDKNSNVNKAFKNLIIALVQQDEWDKVIDYINFHIKGNSGMGRRLEVS